MTKQTSNGLGIILALIAAVLAFSAALIAYVHRGEVDVTPIGGRTVHARVGVIYV